MSDKKDKKKGVQTPEDYQMIKHPGYPRIIVRLPQENQFSLSTNNFPPLSYIQATNTTTKPSNNNNNSLQNYFLKPIVDHLFLTNHKTIPEYDQLVQLVKKNHSSFFH